MNDKTILIVDDSSLMLKVLEVKLRSAGYRILTAEDGGRAFELSRKEAPGLVIMDINFPPDPGRGMGETWDGFRIIEWMRRATGLDNTPVIVITSDELAKHETQLMSAGVAAVFQKPVPIPDLLEAIEACFACSKQPA